MTLAGSSVETSVARARALTDLVQHEAAEAEAIGTLTATTVAALHDSQLFRLLTPACLGGGGASLDTAFDVIEEVARADGAAGWSLMAGMIYLAIAGSLLGDRAVEQVFADPHALIAGQLAPLGTAEAAPGGYRLEGNFGFASGALHAGWLFGGFREQRDGQVVKLPSGLPNVIAALVPRHQVEYLGNWDVIGLMGTGSIDFRVPPQVVPQPYTFPLFAAEPQRGGDRYRMGPSGLTCIGHCAFACGVARRVLDEMAAMSHTKRRLGRDYLVRDPVFQRDYAEAEAQLGAARAFALSALAKLEAAAQGDLTQKARAEARLATTHASQAATAVVDFAYRYAGNAALRNGTALQRCLRDITAGEQHVFTDHNTYRDVAQAYLGVAERTLHL